MNTDETIQSVKELGALMGFFHADRAELLKLTARMRVQLDRLDAQCVAGRPDLKSSL
jgi:hypothetical protein